MEDVTMDVRWLITKNTVTADDILKYAVDLNTTLLEAQRVLEAETKQLQYCFHTHKGRVTVISEWVDLANINECVIYRDQDYYY